MLAQRTTRRLSPVATIGSPSPLYACWLLAVFALFLTLTAGCETAKQEQFQLYSDEGVHLYQHGDYAGARDHFELALALGPKDANILYNLGQCQDRLGQTIRAEDYYKQCLAINTNHPECRHALAVLLYRTGRKTDADQMIQGWLASEPTLAPAYVEDGWRLRQGGEFQLAIGRYQQALHNDPRNTRAMIELGQVYEDHERPELALTMYTRALELNPQQTELKERINALKSKGVHSPLPD